MHDDPVAGRDLDVVGPGIHAADRDRRDDEVRVAQRLALVERARDLQGASSASTSFPASFTIVSSRSASTSIRVASPSTDSMNRRSSGGTKLLDPPPIMVTLTLMPRPPRRPQPIESSAMGRRVISSTRWVRGRSSVDHRLGDLLAAHEPGQVGIVGVRPWPIAKSVAIPPGQRIEQRTPLLQSSWSRARMNPTCACLEAA